MCHGLYEDSNHEDANFWENNNQIQCNNENNIFCIQWQAHFFKIYGKKVPKITKRILKTITLDIKAFYKPVL